MTCREPPAESVLLLFSRCDVDIHVGLYGTKPARPWGKEMSVNPSMPLVNGVLLVDDESAVLDLLSWGAECAGFRPFRATNGAAALEIFRLRHAEIVLIIADVFMPGLDGFSFVRAAREIAPEVKVAISSGSLGDTELRLAADLHVHAFLHKPYSSAQLISCIRTVADPAFGWTRAIQPCPQ